MRAVRQTLGTEDGERRDRPGLAPLWLRAVAMIANTVAGTRDVMASTKK